jgi:hypothetical protein
VTLIGEETGAIAPFAQKSKAVSRDPTTKKYLNIGNADLSSLAFIGVRRLVSFPAAEFVDRRPGISPRGTKGRDLTMSRKS